MGAGIYSAQLSEAKALISVKNQKESYESITTGNLELGMPISQKGLVDQGARYIHCTTEYEHFFGW